MTSDITDTPNPHPTEEPAAADLLKIEGPVVPPVPAPKPSRIKELIVTVLLAAFVGALVASGVLVGFPALRERSAPSAAPKEVSNLEVQLKENLLTQKGQATVTSVQSVAIVYPYPYAKPPALTWRTNYDYFRVSEQTETGFKVTCQVSGAHDFHWVATGVGDKEALDSKRQMKDK